MRAIDEAAAFNHRRSDDSRFAEQLEGDTTTHNIHNGVHRPYLVKMHFLRRHAVNLPFRTRNSLKHRDCFLLHPR